MNARPLGVGALPVEPAYVGDGLERLVDGDLEVIEVDRLGDEIEGAAVHGGADVGHVAVGRDDHRPGRRPARAQLRQQGEAVHHRHVDVEQQQADVGLLGQRCQRLLAVAGEAEGEIALADSLAEALLDQQLEVGLVVDREDFGGLAHYAVPLGKLLKLLLQQIEVHWLGDELRGAELGWPYGGARRRHRP